MGITSETYDVKIDALIPKVEADYLLIRNVPFDTDEADNIVYPSGSDVTAVEMISFKIGQSGKKIGEAGRVLTAESIDSYRASFANAMDKAVIGYPLSIVGNIERFIYGR